MSTKKIYLVRHAESEYNSSYKKNIEMGLKKDPNIRDPQLTNNGIKQAQNIKEKIKLLNPDVIITSPLKRAIQTANIINNNYRIIVHPLATEKITCTGDIGTFRSELNCDLSYIDKEVWWNYNERKINNYDDFINLNSTTSSLIKEEDLEDFGSVMYRMKKLFEFIDDLEYKNICVISHSNFAYMLINKKLKNCEIYELK